jgi:CDP-diacylglycerol--glycerol-3-phosphate 3-phosphatidyltransferase
MPQIKTIQESLERNPSLKVSFLTDALRGTRETPKASCATLLAALADEFGPDRVEVRMYHTPNLTGVRKSIIPKRINEGWGLQHMKLYGVDDEIIMSGANLSDDYFTNRQDRYHIISCKQITDYFAQVHATVCSISYRVAPNPSAPGGFDLDWPTTNAHPAPLNDPKEYITQATKLLAPLLKPAASTKHSLSGMPQTDTQIYPLLQLTPLLKPDTSTEHPALTTILKALATPNFAGSKWTFTAGYFNMTPWLRDLLLASNPASANVIAASPWANGFYGSPGVSGMLPAAYTLLGRRFLSSVQKAGLSQQITLKEWKRGTVNTPGGWSYHAKGIWVTLKGEPGPSVTLVGSSNYTKRSYSLDLEANALIVTRDVGLMRRLKEEEEWLQQYATKVDQGTFEKTERRVGLHVRMAMWIVTLVGGAL